MLLIERHAVKIYSDCRSQCGERWISELTSDIYFMWKFPTGTGRFRELYIKQQSAPPLYDFYDVWVRRWIPIPKVVGFISRNINSVSISVVSCQPVAYSCQLLIEHVNNVFRVNAVHKAKELAQGLVRASCRRFHNLLLLDMWAKENREGRYSAVRRFGLALCVFWTWVS